MRRGAGAAALALACTFTHAAGDGCAAAKALLSTLASRGLFQGAFAADFGDRRTCETAHGLADVERGLPFTVRTASDGGSIAKTMTAAAILQLVAQGRLELDAPVRKYVPDYPHAATRVRHLLDHSAGLPGYDWFDERFGPGKLRTNGMQLDAVAKAGLAPRFTPGTAFSYDNAAYDAAALVVESVSGSSYAEYLAQRFFQPFGMRDAFVRPARLSDFPGTRTRGYRRGEDGLELHDAIEGEAFHGGGNVYVSAFDLRKWAAAFARAEPPVMPARRHAQARARLAGGHVTGLSLSSWYSDAAAARHYYTGHHQGFFAMAYWDARGRTFGLVVNQLLPAWLELQLSRALVAIANGEQAAAPEAPITAPAPTMPSRWRLEGLGDAAVSPGGGRRLQVTPPSGVEYEAFPVGSATWYVPGLDARLHWDKSGRLMWNTVFVNARGERLGAPGQ